jgi:hypothetical protein
MAGTPNTTTAENFPINIREAAAAHHTDQQHQPNNNNNNVDEGISPPHHSFHFIFIYSETSIVPG